MAKGRRGPALFELLGDEGGGTLSVARPPRWWGHRRRGPEGAEPAAPLSMGGAGQAASRPDSRNERVFAIQGDRIRVSLTSFGAGVAVFLVLAFVMAAYVVAGRAGDRAGFRRGYEMGRGAAAGATDEVSEVRGQPPASYLVAPLTVKAGAEVAAGASGREAAKSSASVPSATATAPNAGWVRDLTYIVVQEFPAGAAERARNARDFLTQRGVPAEVVPAAGGGVHLIATQGYNHKDAAQKKLAEQMLAKVRAIGVQYYAAGGGYKLEGYYKTLKRDSW